jgi:hypothetical protein
MLVYRDGQLQRVHHVLNECLIDRGASPSMVELEAYIDGHHITTVQVCTMSHPLQWPTIAVQAELCLWPLLVRLQQPVVLLIKQLRW